MENDALKKFYLLCKEEGIIDLHSKVSIARMVLVAKNHGISGSEEELIKKFNDGYLAFIREQKAEEKEQRKEKLQEMLEQEKHYIETIREISTHTGSDKPIFVLEKEMSILISELTSCEMKREGILDSGQQLYRIGRKKEKDWAIHAGIASGIAGGAVGLATAIDIQNQNKQARYQNEKLLGHIINMQAKFSENVSAREKILEDSINELHKRIGVQSKRLVENLSPIDLLLKLSPRAIKQRYTDTGTFKLTVETQPTPDMKIFDEVNAVVDGTFKAILLDNDEIAGEVLFALPFDGAVKKTTMEGYCIGLKFDRSKKYDVVFAPINLWAIENNLPVSKTDKEVDVTPERKEKVIYYYVKDFVQNCGADIKAYEYGISILKSISKSTRTEELIKYCTTKIEEIKQVEESARVEAEKKSEQQRLKKEKTSLLIDKVVKTILIGTVLVGLLIILMAKIVIPSVKYKDAVSCMNLEKYEEAIQLLTPIEGYKDSEDLILECKYRQFKTLINGKKFNDAYSLAKSISNYKDVNKLTDNFFAVPLNKRECYSYHYDYNVKYEYDDNGNCLIEQYMSDDKLKGTIKYEYDDNGNCVKKSDSYHTGGDSVVEYIYNSDDKCIKEIRTYVTIEYEYDINGKCIKEVSINSNGTQSINNKTYDENNNLIKEEVDDGMIIEYQYNDHGDCTKIKRSYSDGSDGTDEYLYKYDDRGNCIEKDILGGSKYFYEYDLNSNCIKEICYPFISDNSYKTTEYSNYTYYYKE